MSNEPTIITHDPWWQFVIGTVKKLSFSDAEVVNLIYKCSGKVVWEPKETKRYIILRPSVIKYQAVVSH